jgi:protein gp37
MSENTAISWTDHTFNPWWGCAKVSPACDHCYAERDAKRFAPATTLWGVDAARRTFDDKPDGTNKHWDGPLKWNKAAQREGVRRRVFCASMADVFDKNAPEGARERLWRLIHDTPALDWLLLTKRIGNASRMLPPTWLRQPIYGQLPDWPHNLRIGATFCNQDEVNRDIGKLLDLGCPNFASIEPMLGAITLTRIEREEGDWSYLDNALTGFRANKGGGHDGKRLDWVICGGESGPHARPMHPDWPRALRDQCAAAGVPFHFKQHGEWAPHRAGAGGDEGGDLRRGHVRYLQGDGREPDGHFRKGDAAVARVGKAAAGRLLDGVEHNGFPS